MKGSREHLIARAAKVVNAAFNQKLEESRKIGVINIFCAGPMLHLMQDMNSVCEQINQELEHLPFICHLPLVNREDLSAAKMDMET